MKSVHTIRVHQMLSHVTSLGPYKRFVLWTQGCCRHCPGCISPDSQSLSGGNVYSVESIAEKAVHISHEGITISGGEPFIQAVALCNLIDEIKRRRDMGVILYTGYTFEELKCNDTSPEGSDELLNRIDLLIDGPYIQSLNDDRSLRGSSNQRIIPLTDRYNNCLCLYGVPNSRKTEMRFTSDGFFIAGIPTKAEMQLNHLGE